MCPLFSHEPTCSISDQIYTRISYFWCFSRQLYSTRDEKPEKSLLNEPTVRKLRRYFQKNILPPESFLFFDSFFLSVQRTNMIWGKIRRSFQKK